MTVRFYSSIAPEVTLSAGVSNVATVIIVSSTAGFPLNTPYTLALDYGAALEELVEVTNVAGTSLTVTRAIDGTSAAAHGAGAKVRHVSSARDFKDSRDHENASTNVHGLSGGAAVVGTSQAQTLTNKTLTSPSINGGTITGSTHSGGSLTGTIGGSPTISGNPDFSGTPVVSGTLNINGTLSGTGINVPRYVYKSANETRTSTTLSNDSELVISLPLTSTEYVIEAFLGIRGDPAGDFNSSWSTPSGAIGIWAPINFNTGASGNSGQVEIVASAWSATRSYGLHPDGTSIYGIHIKGGIRTGGSSGDLNFQWAALAAGTGATLLSGSWLSAVRAG